MVVNRGVGVDLGCSWHNLLLASMMRTELETTLCRCKFAVANMAWAFLMRVIASFSVGHEISLSFT